MASHGQSIDEFMGIEYDKDTKPVERRMHV